MKYALFIISFLSCVAGALIKDLSDFNTVSLTLIVYGIFALISACILSSNDNGWD